MKIECPRCGGNNEIESVEYEFLTCRFCKNSLFIDFDGISLTYTYKSVIPSEEITMFLKKDFERIGFSENYKIINKLPVYLPFWESGESGFLESASSRIKSEKFQKPSQERIVFDFKGTDVSVEKISPDTQPDIEEKRTLYFLPFYMIIINYKEKEYTYYVDALSGRVEGEPIPFMSGKDIGRFFPLFVIMLSIFFLINLVLNNVPLSLFVNFVLIYLFYNISISEILSKQNKNEH